MKGNHISEMGNLRFVLIAIMLAVTIVPSVSSGQYLGQEPPG
jgi:hypothetical protein